jgi:hypothetical protein
LLALALVGCNDGGMMDQPDSGPPPRIDNDGDGFTEDEGDCNDNNPGINPDAPDPCDGADQNCSGTADEMYDLDDDGITTCQGDCADNDPTTWTGAIELVDGLDNDCDGIIDNHTDQYDDDGDGWTEDQGDCDDDEEFVNPGAVEVQTLEDGNPEMVDNNCDGTIDEPAVGCEGMIDHNDPFSYARAMEICAGVSTAEWVGPSDSRARRIVADLGNTYVPIVGAEMVAFSSGIAGDSGDPGYVAPQSGTTLDFANTAPHPNPLGAIGCSDADSATVNDYTELRLEVQVPTNAQSFSFDFNFMSVEYPEYVCTSFDDTFEVLLESEMFTGNVSFDSMGNPVSINVGFFTVCTIGSGSAGCTGNAELVGTGYEDMGGGTGWLTTTAPVTPGEKIVLRFVIWDEGDHILDSQVLIDNFRWRLEAIDDPTTEG